jgi:hypothetical protein
MKVGQFDRDLHRLDLLTNTVRPNALVMIDANEACVLTVRARS